MTISSKSRQRRRGAVFGRIILRSINVIVATVTIGCAYGGLVSPSTSVLPAFGVMLFPIMVMICLVLLLLDLLLSRLLSLWMIGALAICAVPIINVFPVNPGGNRAASRAPADRKFTFMTYNVFGMVDVSGEPDSIGGKPHHATLECLVRYLPDIVCLQESRPLTSLKHHYPELIDTLTSTYPYRLFDRGHLFLSKYPIESTATGITDGETFSTAAVKAKVEGNDIYILSVHMQSIGLTADDKALFRELTDMDRISRTEIRNAKSELLGKLASAFRERAIQAREIREVADSIKGNMIICGDFNDVPMCYAVRTVRGTDFRDAFADGATGYKITYNHNRFYFRIDHILYRGQLRALFTRRDTNRGSDHYPLITTFEWNK